MNKQKEIQIQQWKQDAATAIDAAQWEQAKNILLQIIQADDNDHYVWHLLGYCHLMLNDTYQAIQCLKKSVAINPEFEHAYIILSHAQVREKDIANAIETLQQLIQTSPKSAEGYSLLGGAYMQNSQYLDAEKCLIESLNLNPDQNNTRLHLGVLQSQLCNYKSSINHLKIVLEAGEHTGEVHNLLGRAYQNSEDYENAMLHYKAAIELMPGVDDPLVNLGIVQDKLRQSQVANKSDDNKKKT